MRSGGAEAPAHPKNTPCGTHATTARRETILTPRAGRSDAPRRVLDEAAAAAAEARKPERYEDWSAAQQKKEAALKKERQLLRATKPKPLGAGNVTKPAAKKPRARAAPTV